MEGLRGWLVYTAAGVTGGVHHLRYVAVTCYTVDSDATRVSPGPSLVDVRGVRFDDLAGTDGNCSCNIFERHRKR